MVGAHEWSMSLVHWVNDGLMAVFFLVVGLEIKRELRMGELREPRTALLPIVAAVGGAVVPALIYIGINLGGPGASGLGHPDGHRHRFRPGRAGHRRVAGARLAQGVPDHPGHRR